MNSKILKRLEPKDLPWVFASPVKKSQYIPLDDSFKRFNVEIDLSEITSFRDPSRKFQGDELLFSDFQSDPTVGTWGRLGSCRSGFYRDHYLKGVGRTPLLKSWSDFSDVVQSSGHLSATEGLREWLVTSYFEARAKTEVVVPCSSLLVKPLIKSLRDCAQHGAPANNKFQLISVKKGIFARPSNFVWMAQNLSPKTSISSFFEFCLKFLTPEGYPTGDATPRNCAKMFEVAIRNGLNNFKTFFELGVHWNFCYNNFSLDGRFVDLDSPLVMGFPGIGVLAGQSEGKSYLSFVGLDLFQYVRETRSFLDYTINRLEFLLSQRHCLNLRDEMMAQDFLVQITKKDGPISTLLSEAYVKRFAFDMIRKSIEISQRSLADLKKFINCGYKEVMGHSPSQCREFMGRKIYVFSSQQQFYSPHFWTPNRDSFSVGQAIEKEIMEPLEASTRVETFFDKLSRVPRDVKSLLGNR